MITFICFTCFEELHPNRLPGLTSYEKIRCFRCGRGNEKGCLYDSKFVEDKNLFDKWLKDYHTNLQDTQS